MSDSKGKHSKGRRGAGSRRPQARAKRDGDGRGRGGSERGARPGARGETRDLIVLPVRNMILFPGVALPLVVGRASSIRAIQAAVADGQPVALLLQRDAEVEEPSAADLYRVGTLAEILRYWPLSEERHNAICQSHARVRVLEFLQHEPYLVARVEVIPPDERRTRPIEARFRALKERAQEVIELAPSAPDDLAQAVQAIDSPNQLADLVATFMEAPAAEKQKLLETFDIRERLDRLNHVLGDLEEVLRLSQKIRQDTKGTLDRAQREYYLREQLRAIRRELGEEEDADEELEELRARLEGLVLPEEAREHGRKELRRLARMSEASAEHAMLRTWVDVFLELPWEVRSTGGVDLERAARVLDEDHHGLQNVKRRILEALAVRKLGGTAAGSILCLVGPPGVGKTSLGRSVARALGRAYTRVSLGGVHDEAEIRGHRRTYVGAMPGNVLAALRKVGTRDPVFVLDEVDKLGRGLHGDPGSALLEVLDPAQNTTFLDNYLGVPFDLSEVFFVATANDESAIPAALRDRMEVLHVPGYTEEEKLVIAREHLVRRQLEATGLDRSTCRFQVAALREIVRHHTREAGVRGFEREIGALCRHVAARVARRRPRRPVVVDAALVAQVLGPRRHEHETRDRTRTPGVATGLAWTPTGGEILFVEATRMTGKGELLLTGQLGDVMRESARAALSLVRSRAVELGIAPEVFQQEDLHVHLPAGAVPKDGPSAGVALYAALVSLLTGRRVRPEVAMTGEVSLRGLVLPVGGIKEKVLGAEAAGIRKVLLPARNEPDLLEVPESARKALEFVFLEDVADVLQHALVPLRRSRKGH